MEKKEFRRFLVVGTLCALGIYGCSKNTNDPEQPPKFTPTPNKVVKKSQQPTVFFHGYKGNRLSFGGMILRMTRAKVATRSILITVASDGTLTTTGDWQIKDNPLIQVVFEDNTNHEWQQAIWIQTVLTYLRDEYQVTKINAVGHSMGGVALLRYLLTYGPDNLPLTISKLVTIGSPFNEFVEEPRTVQQVEEFGPTAVAPRFTSYLQEFNHLPSGIAYLNIAGDVDGDGVGDGTVPLGSAVASNYLFKSNQYPYQFKMVTGRQAQHSALHENREVDQMIIDFLWENK